MFLPLIRPKKKATEEMSPPVNTLKPLQRTSSDMFALSGAQGEAGDMFSRVDDPPTAQPLRRPVKTIESTVDMSNVAMPEGPTGGGTTATMPIIYDTPDMRPPYDAKGRPVRPYYEDPLEADLTYQQDLRTWKPKQTGSRWKDIGLGVLGGFLRGMGSGDIGQGIGAAIGGGLTGTFNPTLSEEIWRQKELGETQGNIESEYGRRAADVDLANKQLEGEERRANIGYKKSQTELAPLKLEIQRLKNVADTEYKQNLIKLGKQKADDVRAYREAIIDLRDRGLDQNDERIKQLEKRIEETKRHNKVTEGQGQQRIGQRQQQIEQNQQRIDQSQQNQNQRLKVMKMAQVRKYAQENGLSLSEAVADFESAGYDVQD